MSQELLKKAKNLDHQLLYLRSNKNLLDLFLSDSYKERELEISASVSGENKSVCVLIEPENFKKVAFVLNQINERQLSAAEQEFKMCFNQSEIK
jgi:hypothetical protein